MQDIPRNELLDKLAAGWKVRRSTWPKEHAISKNGGSITIAYTVLIEDDWEGTPPLFQRFTNCNCVFAFTELHKNEAKMVRRKIWEDSSGYEIDDEIILHYEDLAANDWEVWA
jgi:hypothetical protein